MRAVLTVVVVLAGSRAGLAGDSPRATAAPAGAGNDASISAAKKEFDAMRANRGLPADQRGALPKFDLPTPGISSGSTSSAPAPDAVKPTKKKSENWLVDAMAKKDDPTRSGRPTREKDVRSPDQTDPLAVLGSAKDDDDAPPSLLQLELARAQSEREAAAAAAERKPDPAAAPNPLNSFMADWMSARDYALLKPTGGGPNASGSGASGFGAPASATGGGPADALSIPGSATAAIFGGDGLGGSPGGVFPGAPSATALANPYLQPLDLPAAPPSASSNLAPPSASTMAAPLLSSPSTSSDAPALAPIPAPAPAQPARQPGFVPPQTDDKYFKQLKRF